MVPVYKLWVKNYLFNGSYLLGPVLSTRLGVRWVLTSSFILMHCFIAVTNIQSFLSPGQAEVRLVPFFIPIEPIHPPVILHPPIPPPTRHPSICPPVHPLTPILPSIVSSSRPPTIYPPSSHPSLPTHAQSMNPYASTPPTPQFLFVLTHPSMHPFTSFLIRLPTTLLPSHALPLTQGY